MTPATPRVTVVFLLYNAERTVGALAEALSRQARPGTAHQADWLEAVFMDDASLDRTPEALAEALRTHGQPAHWRVTRNPHNRGLAATLNEALAPCARPTC